MFPPHTCDYFKGKFCERFLTCSHFLNSQELGPHFLFALTLIVCPVHLYCCFPAILSFVPSCCYHCKTSISGIIIQQIRSISKVHGVNTQVHYINCSNIKHTYKRKINDTLKNVIFFYSFQNQPFCNSICVMVW